MPILNYTTKIDAYKTVGEIQQILARAGASKITMDMNPAGQPISLTFCIAWNGTTTAFMLPCNVVGILAAMQKDKKVPRAQCTEGQALRVAWRILKDWVEAQLAIIEAEMATTLEVFLPYAITKDGGTLYSYTAESEATVELRHSQNNYQTQRNYEHIKFNPSPRRHQIRPRGRLPAELHRNS